MQLMARVQGLHKQAADAWKVHDAGAERVAVYLHVKLKSSKKGHGPFFWARNP